jgi:RNA polymerase sigma-70 factor, ECF subfamily
MADADRFEAFVREYQDMVFATAVRLLGRVAEAEDVSQTVFLRAFEHFDRIGASPEAPGWLKTVTMNLCLNHLSRYRARWRFFSELAHRKDAGRPPFVPDQIAAATVSPEADLVDTLRHASLERAVQGLPDAQRVPLVLFHFEGLSYRDIAAMLGVSLAKVKTDIHRGRETLKQELSAHGAR